MKIGDSWQAEKTLRPGNAPHSMTGEALQRAYQEVAHVASPAGIQHHKGRLAGEPRLELRRPNV
jgi:hypothetical protein